MTATETGPLTAAELDLIDAWWRAAFAPEIRDWKWTS